MTDSRVPDYAVLFRGHWACPCQVAWIPVYEAELQRRGILIGPLPIAQLIGFFGGSGGTHAKGGACDFWCPKDPGQAVWVARQMGAPASWHRPENWDGADGSEHLHEVLAGCPHNEPARYQIEEVFDGGDGLTGSAPDPGPRPIPQRTWREGIAWALEQGDEMADPKVLDQLDRIEADGEQALKELRAFRSSSAENKKEVRKALEALAKRPISTRAQVQRVIDLLTEAPE